MFLKALICVRVKGYDVDHKCIKLNTVNANKIFICKIANMMNASNSCLQLLYYAKEKYLMYFEEHVNKRKDLGRDVFTLNIMKTRNGDRNFVSIFSVSYML